MRPLHRSRLFYVAESLRATVWARFDKLFGTSLPATSQAHDCRFLQEAFKKAVQSAQRSRRRIFLEVFCGTGGLAATLRRRGFGAVSLDLRLGPEMDITMPHVQRLLIGWMSSNCVAGLWLGTPCASWSRARRGPPGSTWCAIRSATHLYGLPNLRPIDQHKINIGNNTMKASARLISAARRFGVPCFLENPSTSLLWLADPIQKQAAFGSRRCTFDFCQFGTRWRKRTTVMMWGAPLSPELERRCSGRRGCCSRTGAPHIQLSGSDRASGQMWTHIAEPYPRALCHTIADLLASAGVFAASGSGQVVCMRKKEVGQ